MKKSISLVLILVLTSCYGGKHLAWYKKLQDDLSYEQMMEENQAFKKSSAKSALRDTKKSLNEEEKKAKEQAKVDSIYSQIRKLKSQNQ